MHFLDWLLIALPFCIVIAVGIIARRQMKSVADFANGGRVAGPYLLAVAGGELQAGAVVFVASFELTAQAGFTLGWWHWIYVPISILVAITGFVTYRFRETRALTLAQFFELRYSKSFRVFTGLLGFFAGLVNFGIIPAVGARCMVYFIGLPPQMELFGWQVPTYIPLMALFLGIALFMATSGGYLSVMITDCVEGILSQIFYLVIIAALLCMFSWSQIIEVLQNRPPGQSMLNPFDTKNNADFNLYYILMTIFVGVYGTMAWQNASGQRSAALSPHTSRMASLLGRWREHGKAVVITLLAICALTYLNHPDFAAQSQIAHAEVAAITQPQVQTQMEIPIALSHLLPIGIKGILCAVLLMGIFGGDATHLHSWGSIFVQDVLVPLRKKPFEPKQHLRVLRWVITGVAVFAFLFGTLFQQTEYILMWWAITTAIYVGGAGACIIGGLYWKKGTVAGAWTALITGSTLSVGGIILRQIYGKDFPLNGQEVSFFACCTAITMYVVVSLLTCRKDHNMDRMLHRGAYAAVIDEVGEKRDPEKTPKKKLSLGRFIGMDSNFTTGDKWIAGSLFGWGIFWFAVVIVGSVWNVISPWPLSVWISYWHFVGIGIPIFISFITAIWFTWGGIRDIKLAFHRLRHQQVNHLDDGTVVDHQNLDERAAIKNVSSGQS